MFRSAASLNSIQSEITRMLIIDAFSKSIILAETSISLLESIKPKFSFTIEKTVEKNGNALTITFNLVNNGKFEIIVVPTSFFNNKNSIKKRQRSD